MDDLYNNNSLNLTEIAKSQEIYTACEKIGDKFGLHIDQVGELDSEIRGILLQINKSSDFITHIIERLEVTRSLAEQIATEVNQEVFQVIKTKAQTNPQKDRGSERNFDNTSLEQAGGFSVEKPVEERSNLSGNVAGNTMRNSDQHEPIEHKDDILAGIENPTSGSEKIFRKEKTIEQKYLEPLIDHLLKGSVAQPAIPITQSPNVLTLTPKGPSQPAVPQNTPKRAGPDPYKEAF